MNNRAELIKNSGQSFVYFMSTCGYGKLYVVTIIDEFEVNWWPRGERSHYFTSPQIYQYFTKNYSKFLNDFKKVYSKLYANIQRYESYLKLQQVTKVLSTNLSTSGFCLRFNQFLKYTIKTKIPGGIMPRIRSIKPEFWTDGTNLELSDSCALFFIGMWNFCDDEGKHKLDLKQLAAELGGRWHVGKVKLFLSCLAKSGQLIINSESTWIQLTGWSHQKIDKPKQPDVKTSDLQWLSIEESAKALDDSRGINARIGEDRRDRIGSRIGEEKKIVRRNQVQAPPALPTEKISSAIARYAETWKARYKANPPIGGKESGILKRIVKDHGLEKTIQFIEAYLEMSDHWFLTKRHDLPTLESNLNSVTQFIQTGRLVTRREIAHQDDSMATRNLLDMIDRGEL